MLIFKIFYIFFEPWIIGKHRKDICECWKGPNKIVCNVMKNIKNDIMGVKNINVLIGEN
jgi:hypothetical protein